MSKKRKKEKLPAGKWIFTSDPDELAVLTRQALAESDKRTKELREAHLRRVAAI